MNIFMALLRRELGTFFYSTTSAVGFEIWT